MNRFITANYAVIKSAIRRTVGCLTMEWAPLGVFLVGATDAGLIPEPGSALALESNEVDLCVCGLRFQADGQVGLRAWRRTRLQSAWPPTSA